MLLGVLFDSHGYLLPGFHFTQADDSSWGHFHTNLDKIVVRKKLLLSSILSSACAVTLALFYCQIVSSYFCDPAFLLLFSCNWAIYTTEVSNRSFKEPHFYFSFFKVTMSFSTVSNCLSNYL